MKLDTKNKTVGQRKKVLLFSFSLLVLILAIGATVFFFLSFGLKGNSNKIPTSNLEIKENFTGKLYFNNELGETIFSPLIIEAVDGAQKSIELAVYSMDDAKIREAFYRAAGRGVKVTLVFSDKRKSGHDRIFKNLPSNIKRLDVPSNDGYMHHKFLIIDRGTSRAKLFFGSYNFTYLQERYDPCFLLETTRPEIIAIFGQEFDRLVAGLHGREKIISTGSPLMTRIQYLDGFLEIWFTPQNGDGLKERMATLIKNSQKNIKILIWNFTSNSLAQELVAVARGKSVQIITDDVNFLLPQSTFNFILDQKKSQGLEKLEIITDTKRNQEAARISGDNTLNSFLHHHLLLIDSETAVFGTNNWSENGFYYSDESVMISNISSLVQPFTEAWQFNYEKNK